MRRASSAAVVVDAPSAMGIALERRVRRFCTVRSVRAYLLSLVAICITNTWDLMAGTSRALANTGALVVTCIIFVLAILQFLYAKAMQQRGFLR